MEQLYGQCHAVTVSDVSMWAASVIAWQLPKVVRDGQSPSLPHLGILSPPMARSNQIKSSGLRTRVSWKLYSWLKAERSDAGFVCDGSSYSA